MKQYAKKENFVVQPKRIIISNVLTNGTIIFPLLLFYLKLGLDCKKTHRFVQYTPRKCFNISAQIATDERRQGDENPISSVVAETMKTTSSQFLWLSDHGSQLTHSDKVSDRCKNPQCIKS